MGRADGQVVWWIPLLIVASQGFWNVDAYKVPGRQFPGSELAFGLASSAERLGVEEIWRPYRPSRWLGN